MKLPKLTVYVDLDGIETIIDEIKELQTYKLFETDDHCCSTDDCGHCKWYEAKNAIQKRILSIPAADVRPVVLCKDCRSYNKPQLGFCETHLVRMHRDDYCSYGKKREE